VIVDCLQSDSGKVQGKDAAAYGGSEESVIGADHCGKCLIDANWGTFLRYPYDLHIKGTLLDDGGKPVENMMVEFFLPNGWTIKTRTSKTGYFRILMGATEERLSKEPLVLDVGTRRMKKGSKMPYYAIYMMPDPFKPCAVEAQKKPAPVKKKK